jgi:hypothetical protein
MELKIRRGRNRNIMVNVDDVGIAKEISSLAQPFSIFSPGLAGITKSESYVSDGVLLRTIARGDANIVLRNILLRLWGTPAWDKFIYDLREIFPKIHIDVTFEKTTDEYISVKVNTGNISVPLELAGTGVLQATQILSYTHLYNPSILVLDEPDSHLHPNNQRLLCGLLHAIAEDRGTQILLTTHSRHVVDTLGSTASILWVRNARIDVASQDDEIGILLDIGALDVKERIANDSAKAIVLTEDERVRGLGILLESSGFVMNETALLSYYGCTEIKNLRPLLKIVQEKNKKAKLIVHRDRDYLSDDDANKWEESLRSLGVEPFLTVGVDIESHFLIASALVSANPTLDLPSAEALLQEAYSKTVEKCVEKYVNGKTDLARKAGQYAKVNPGALAVEANKAISTNPKRFAHGKTVLTKVRELYREANNLDLKTFQVSSLIEVPSLVTVARKAFGAKNS